ncbi:hypothetical protein TNIN_33981 [Trichonephila inaurata madagascariensis]|uniref:C2H2-type domain-containing protein n=1 Tax=Trichonephila inaurata madagascariensis TaxID=2747483 RepID=A0A8X6MCF6_9ARAC|nr:hypothetical protein TNIN_33981 [Trichonephila inaurata madagascariensis]
MTESELRALFWIPVPFPDPLVYKTCYNPRAPETMRKQGIFKSNSRYTRHLRNAHGIDTTNDVFYYCSTCNFKGTVKEVKDHHCSNHTPQPSASDAGPSVPNPRLDLTQIPLSAELGLGQLVDPIQTSIPTPVFHRTSPTSTESDDDVPVDVPTVTYPPLCSTPTKNSVVGPSFTLPPYSPPVQSFTSTPAIIPDLKFDVDETPSSSATSPILHPNIFHFRSCLWLRPALDLSNMASLSTIPRTLRLHLYLGPRLHLLVLTPLKPLPSTQPVLTPTMGSPTPSPVLHPLANQFQKLTSISPSPALVCVYCERRFKTQKGLNSHLVGVHCYGVVHPEEVVSHELPSIPPSPPKRGSSSSLDNIDSLCNELAGAILAKNQSHTKDPHPPGVSATARLRYDPAESSRLQKAFKTNPKTVESILGGTSPYCKIPQDSIIHHFSKCFSRCDVPADYPFPSYSEPVAIDLLLAAFSPPDIWDKLAYLTDSAPGPDGIGYSLLKARDPGAHLLSKVLNVIQDLATVPRACKTRVFFSSLRRTIPSTFLTGARSCS